MTFEELGAIIRQERERRGLTVDEVMEITKISRRNITAIEEGDTKELPHTVYAKGFVRNYARVLGIDEDVVNQGLISAYGEASREHVPQEAIGESEVDVTLMGDSKKAAWPSVLLILVIIAAMGYGVWFFYIQKQDDSAAPEAAERSALATEALQPQAEESPTPPSEPEEEVLDAAGDTPVTAPDQPADPQPVKDESGDAVEQEQESAASEDQPSEASQDLPGVGGNLAIRTRPGQSCWMEVVVDGAKPREYLLQGGQDLDVSYGNTLKVRLGNAGGVEVSHNGQLVDLSLEPGKVKTLRFP